MKKRFYVLLSFIIILIFATLIINVSYILLDNNNSFINFTLREYIYISFIIAILSLITFASILHWNTSLKKKVHDQTTTLKKELESKHNIEKELLIKNDEITKQNQEIRSNQKKLEQLNASLEDTVEKRTMLLNRTNVELEISMNSLKDKQAELTQTNLKLQNSLDSLKNAQSQLIESEKQASLGRLVTGISHEINTPLGNSITGVSFMKNEIEKFKEGNNNIDPDTSIFLSDLLASSKLILNNLEIAANLINRFKQLSINTNISQIQTINLNDFLNTTLLNLTANTMSDMDVSFELHAKKTYYIKTYPALLEQVVISLFSNSLIHGFDKRNFGKIDITLYNSSSHLYIEFKDDGIGIDKANTFKIFDPFFTTKRGHGCIGLGLHIVYIIVTQVFNGSINLIDKSQGAAFLIRLNKLEQIE